MRLKSAAKLFSLLLLVGCSTTEPEVVRFQNLDYDAKTVFLAYYPYLNADQKEALLAGNANPEELIQSWAGQFNDPHHEVGSFEEMMNNARNRRIVSLEIETDASEPITSGNQITARAFAVYSNEKKVEVTPDVDWRVEPAAAKVEKNVVEFGCLSGEMTISANFLQEKEGSRTIIVKKPIQSIEIALSEATLGEDKSFNYQLALLAHCKDGTQSDVSCQAQWRAVNSSGEEIDDYGNISGCGSWVISKKQQRSGESMIANARYADRSVRKVLQPPFR